MPPRRARIIALAHQELEEQGTLVEAPVPLPIAQNLAEESAGRRFPQEVLLIGRRLISVSR